MTSRRTSIILLTMMLAAACTGCDLSSVQGSRARYDDPSLPPGAGAFRKANDLIDPASIDRQEASGNTPEAKKLAVKFGEVLETMQEVVFEKGLLGGSVKNNVRTHCELSEDTAVFLVYVPELRKYTNKAQKTLVDVGWMIAKGSVEGIRTGKDLERTQVVVGFRGVLLYGAAGVGPASGEKPSRTYVNGAVPEDTFYQFFGRPMGADARRAAAGAEAPRTPLAPLNMPKRSIGTRPPHPSIALVRGGPPSAAFAIADDLLVTAQDALLVTQRDWGSDRSTVELELPDGRVVEGHVVAKDNPSGLALLRVTPGVMPILPVAEASSITAGTQVTLWSAPARHGEPTQISEGQIDAVTDIGNRFDLDTPIGIARRAVGGPLIDPHGRVVGVPIWIPTADGPVIVSAQHITELVNRHALTARNK